MRTTMSDTPSFDATNQLKEDMLRNVLRDAFQNVKHLRQYNPLLADFLDANLSFAQQDCDDGERSPRKILQGYVKSEAIMVRAWNRHRLGNSFRRNIPCIPHRIEDDVAEDGMWLPLQQATDLWGVSIQAPNQKKLDLTKADSEPAEAEPKLTKKRVKPCRSKVATQRYDKLSCAPSANTNFPDAPANVTVAEIVCFFPQWFKSVDVIERAISNGGTSGAIARMANAFRHMPKGDVTSNSIYAMMKPSMRKLGGQYTAWSVGNHALKEGHDANSISVAGFRMPGETHQCRQKKPKSIPFKELAAGVKKLPRGDDALDLTRCVIYHTEHEDETWNFPEDYNKLVAYLGGPKPVCPGNYDAEVFGRWTTQGMKNSTKYMFDSKRDNHGRLLKRRREDDNEESECDDKGTQSTHGDAVRTSHSAKSHRVKRRKIHPVTPTRPARARLNQSSGVLSESESDDGFRGSRRADAQGRKNARLGSIRRSNRISETGQVDYKIDPLDQLVEDDLSET